VFDRGGEGGPDWLLINIDRPPLSVDEDAGPLVSSDVMTVSGWAITLARATRPVGEHLSDQINEASGTSRTVKCACQSGARSCGREPAAGTDIAE